MKKIVLLSIFLSLHTSHSLLTNYNPYEITPEQLSTLRNLLDDSETTNSIIDDTPPSPETMIAMLQQEIEILKQKIVSIHNQLASMRVNGGGRGAFKPEMLERATKLKKELNQIDTAIRNKKSQIYQLLAGIYNAHA